jgi:hypothetical protein
VLEAALVSVLVMLSGCAETTASPAPASGSARARSENRQPMTYGGGDGLSCETRVKVHADNEIAGVAAEYGWLQAKYPGYERGMQSLSQCGETPADILHIKTAQGKELDVYFDISEFYGHM